MSEIMKKVKHGEFSKVADGTPAREKLDSGIMKEYKHGELSADVSKKPKEKMESWSKAKITQGSHNN